VPPPLVLSSVWCASVSRPPGAAPDAGCRCACRAGGPSGPTGIVTGGARRAGRRPRPGLGGLAALGYPVRAARASGGIGRRARFRSVCPKGRGGSTPPSRTQPRDISRTRGPGDQGNGRPVLVVSGGRPRFATAATTSAAGSADPSDCLSVHIEDLAEGSHRLGALRSMPNATTPTDAYSGKRELETEYPRDTSGSMPVGCWAAPTTRTTSGRLPNASLPAAARSAASCWVDRADRTSELADGSTDAAEAT
jgi:hypothetical protein